MSEELSHREGFDSLLNVCKKLNLLVKFGLPKHMSRMHGAAIYYRRAPKRSIIYLPKGAKRDCSGAYNAMLAHEIGHYLIITNECSIVLRDDPFFYVTAFFEEGLAWLAAIYCARILQLKIDKDFKRTINKGLNSYISGMYARLEDDLVFFLAPLYRALLGDNHGEKSNIQSKKKKKYRSRIFIR
jgi:hypothetical protein